MKNHSKLFAAAAAALILSTPVFAQKDQGNHTTHQHEHGGSPSGGQAAKLVTDPVCGMKIDPKTATAKTVYAGKAYYFCSKDEKEKFDKDPEKYLKKQG